MSLLSSAQKLLPGVLGQTGRPQGREVLTLRPIRHPAVFWERVGDEQLVVLTVRRRSDPLMNFVAKLFGIPQTRKIELTDEISSYVWTCCDGAHTVSQIADDLVRRYKLTKRQSEVSVLTYLKTLQAKKLIGVPAEQARAFKLPAQPQAAATKTPISGKENGYHAPRNRRAKHSR